MDCRAFFVSQMARLFVATVFSENHAEVSVGK